MSVLEYGNGEICKELYDDVWKEFFINCIEYRNRPRGLLGTGETRDFQMAIVNVIVNICKLNPSSDKAASMIRQLFRSFHFMGPLKRYGIIGDIRRKVLPLLWRDHRAIERKKQKRLTFLANELSNAGRQVEGHIARTIVKPYIRGLNRKWSKMTAFEKLYVTPWFPWTVSPLWPIHQTAHIDSIIREF